MKINCTVSFLLFGTLAVPACGGESSNHSRTGAGGANTNAATLTGGTENLSGAGAGEANANAATSTGGTENRSGTGALTSFGGNSVAPIASTTGSTSAGGTLNLPTASGGTTQSSASTGTSGKSTLVEALVGGVCSPAGSRGCLANDTSGQAICSADSRWQWVADCASGQVCDPRPGNTVGKCVAPSSTCKGKKASICSGGWLIECSESGLIIHQSYCPSGNCSSNVCSKMPACVTRDGHVECRPECTGAKPCAVVGNKDLSGATVTASQFEEMEGLTNGVVMWYLPGGSNFPSAPKCPDTHVFLLYPTDKRSHAVPLPARYWAVKAPLTGLPETYASVVDLACTATEADRLVSYAVFNSTTEALLIATTDPNAEPFILTMELYH